MCDKVECEDAGYTYAEWMEAVATLASAKHAEATEFLRVKAAGKDRTDGTASRMAYVAVGSAVELAQARVDWMRAHMGEES